MEATRILSKPTTRLVSSPFTHLKAITNPLRGQITTRSHKTTARTKRSLNIAPHPSFTSSPSTSRIIYNPPASEPNIHHTPFKFLPKSDPRRRANLQALFGTTQSAANPEAPLPPKLNVPSRNTSYNLTREDVAEIRRLRSEDPVKWSVARLADKFNCTQMFITICSPPLKEHHERLQRRMEAVKARWGPIRTKAREERERRKEMLFRGEL